MVMQILELSNYAKNNSQILIYQAQDGKVKIETEFENETVWLTQANFRIISKK